MKSIKTILAVLFLIAAFGFNSVPYVEGCDHDDEYGENESE